MDIEEYRDAIAEAAVLKRSELHTTLRCLNYFAPHLAPIIQTAIDSGGIERPPEVKSRDEFIHHQVSCTADQAGEIYEALMEAETHFLGPDYESTAESARFGEVGKKWFEISERLDQ
ncbi:MAG: hypothetical protein DWQ47_12710 [Acidobacteria bacterium]|nr:MAG: hypothetical protein DWQ32_00110 [Acidobacteriota bacterium]REK03053.1 MAG: hypothetical protein DWQ38_12025 [Acidobacteriota bacterium]REK13143.1 MAG: hypothetical protein DWQ43_05800 [Acidobacteriota bacterium]REK41137.1 MAG: hypothetical protein DWQ47_12710 [Acidobacteriota bacterium]